MLSCVCFLLWSDTEPERFDRSRQNWIPRIILGILKYELKNEVDLYLLKVSPFIHRSWRRMTFSLSLLTGGGLTLRDSFCLLPPAVLMVSSLPFTFNFHPIQPSALPAFRLKILSPRQDALPAFVNFMLHWASLAWVRFSVLSVICGWEWPLWLPVERHWFTVMQHGYTSIIHSSYIIVF